MNNRDVWLFVERKFNTRDIDSKNLLSTIVNEKHLTWKLIFFSAAASWCLSMDGMDAFDQKNLKWLKDVARQAHVENSFKEFEINFSLPCIGTSIMGVYYQHLSFQVF